MTAHAATLDADTRRHRRHFALRRLHSLSGVVPVGAFLIVHLWTNSKAMLGPASFGHAVEEINSLPFLLAVEVLGIFAPLAFHAIYGVVLAFQSSNNVGAYGYNRNWMYVLQRVTGILAFLFIIIHLKDFRVAKALGVMQYQGFFGELGNLLAVRWRALVYLLGTTAAVFHFANGLRTFLWSWGLTVSERSQRLATRSVTVLGVALWLLGANTILFFATGGSMMFPASWLRGEGGADPGAATHPVSAPTPMASVSTGH
jgi:succinate dehydrogenase/fumarate reductase cytochrome b subunit (b558 family)